MCDAIYLGAALLGLLAVGTTLRLVLDRMPNADLVIELLANDGEPIVTNRQKQAPASGGHFANA